MLVDPDDGGPWIQALAPLQLKLGVKRLVQVPARAATCATHTLEVAEILAGPQQAALIALGAAVALADAGHRLGERTTARSTREASLAHDQAHRQVTQRLVADLHDAVVVHAARRGGAPRADLERRFFLDFDAQRDGAGLPPAPFEFQLR